MTEFRAAHFPDEGPSYRGTVTVEPDGAGRFTSDQVQILAENGQGFVPDAGTLQIPLTPESVQALQQEGQSWQTRLVRT